MPLYKLSAKFNIKKPGSKKSSVVTRQMLIELILDENKSTYSGFILGLPKGTSRTLMLRILHPDAEFICSASTFRESEDNPAGYMNGLSPQMLAQLGTVTPIAPDNLLANNNEELNKYPCLREMFLAAYKANTDWINILSQAHPPTFLKITIGVSNKYVKELILVKDEGTDYCGEQTLKKSLRENIAELIKNIALENLKKALQEQPRQMAEITPLKENMFVIKEVNSTRIHLNKIVFFEKTPMLFKEVMVDDSGDTLITPLVPALYSTLLTTLFQQYTSAKEKDPSVNNKELEAFLRGMAESHKDLPLDKKQQLDTKDERFSKKILSSPVFFGTAFKINQAVLCKIIFNKITLPIQLIILISPDENNQCNVFCLSSISTQFPNEKFLLNYIKPNMLAWLNKNIKLKLCAQIANHTAKATYIEKLISAIKTHKITPANETPQENKNIIFYKNINDGFMQEGDQLIAITNDSLPDNITDELLLAYVAQLHLAQGLDNAKELKIVKEQTNILNYFNTIYLYIKAQVEASNNTINQPYKFDNKMLSCFLERKWPENEKITLRIIHVNNLSKSPYPFIPGHTFCAITINEEPIHFLAIFLTATNPVNSKKAFIELMSPINSQFRFSMAEDIDLKWVALNDNFFFNLFLFFEKANAEVHVLDSSNAQIAIPIQIPIPQIHPPQPVQALPPLPQPGPDIMNVYMGEFRKLQMENKKLNTQLRNFDEALKLRYERSCQPLSVNFTSQQDAFRRSVGEIMDFLITNIVNLEWEVDDIYLSDIFKLSNLSSIFSAIATGAQENRVESITAHVNAALKNLGFPLLEQPWVVEEEKQIEYDCKKWILFLFECMTLNYEKIDQAIKKEFESLTHIEHEDLQINFRLALKSLLQEKINEIDGEIQKIQRGLENKFHLRMEKLKKEVREMEMKINMTAQLEKQQSQFARMHIELNKAIEMAQTLYKHLHAESMEAPDINITKTQLDTLLAQLMVTKKGDVSDEGRYISDPYWREMSNSNKEEMSLNSEETAALLLEETNIAEPLPELPRDKNKENAEKSTSSLQRNSTFKRNRNDSEGSSDSDSESELSKCKKGKQER